VAANKKDFIFTYDPTNGGYAPRDTFGAGGSWSPANPTVDQVGYGFFYYNNQATNETFWVENFVINP
jgi:hypothetical protein